MPIYLFKCCSCHELLEGIFNSDEEPNCPSCQAGPMRKLPTAASIIVRGNSGPKLKDRVTLDDELKKSGFSSPLFPSDEVKDKTRWLLKKVGIGSR